MLQRISVLAQKLEKAFLEITSEYGRARSKFEPFNSAHEAYAIILEELDEFWDSVKRNKPSREELVQMGAMVLAALIELPLLHEEKK